MLNDFKCYALQVQQPSAQFYVAAVNVAELETICRPLKRSATNELLRREHTEPVALTKSQVNSLVHSLESTRFHSRSVELLAEEREEPYQRFIDEKRSAEIARYLKEPTAL